MSRDYVAPGGGWQFRPDIEGLRAIAILFVVGFHADFWFAPGGFFGVDIFFVLSGFLITGILVDEAHRTGAISLREFWARRARRLLPAALVLSVTVLLGSYLLLSPFQTRDAIEGARWFSVYASNILFVTTSKNYFAGDDALTLLRHTWSLSIEEQFYLVAGPLLAAVAVWKARSGSRAFDRTLGAVVAAGAVLSFAACTIAPDVTETRAFYLLPTRAWELGVGALLAITGVGIRNHTMADVLGFTAMATLVAFLILVGPVGHPGWVTLAPVFATAALIVAGNAGGIVSRVLSLAPLRFLGRVSYSWYLWHWPILVYLHSRVRHPGTKMNAVFAVAALVPAIVGYWAVEMPVRRNKWLAARPLVTLCGAAASVVITLLVTVALSRANDRILAEPAMQLIERGRTEVSDARRDGCVSEMSSSEMKACPFGVESDTVVVLLGDSHAGHWFAALQSVVNQRHWRLVTYLRSSCAWQDVKVQFSKFFPYPECNAWRARAVEQIVALRPTLIVLGSLQSIRIVSGSRTTQATSDSSGLDTWMRGSEATFRKLSASGAIVLQMRDTPASPHDIPNCLGRNRSQPQRCAFNRDMNRFAKLMAAESALAASYGVTLADLNALLCPALRCDPMRDGYPLFTDRTHLSVPASRTLTPALAREIDRALASSRNTRKSTE